MVPNVCPVRERPGSTSINVIVPIAIGEYRFRFQKITFLRSIVLISPTYLLPGITSNNSCQVDLIVGGVMCDLGISHIKKTFG